MIFEDEHMFSNVLKWFTGDDRITIKDRHPVANYAASTVAAATVNALVPN